MKQYTIVGGAHGVGKSSLLGALSAVRTDLGIIIDTDKITAECGGKTAEERINECLQQGVSFTQETTLSGALTVNTIKAAQESGYKIRLCYISIESAEECISRIVKRVCKGGHSVSSEEVQRSFSERFDVLASVLPLCDEAVFFDNENGFVAAAEYKNGEFIMRSESNPCWIVRLGDYFSHQNGDT